LSENRGCGLWTNLLSNLDALVRLRVRAELKKLQKDLGITTIYVVAEGYCDVLSHSILTASSLSRALNPLPPALPRLHLRRYPLGSLPRALPPTKNAPTSSQAQAPKPSPPNKLPNPVQSLSLGLQCRYRFTYSTTLLALSTIPLALPSV